MKLIDLLKEDDGVPCLTWADKSFVNGDGIKTPKITISKTDTMVTGTYEGPEKGFCIQSAKGNKGDSVHQLATITVFQECNPYLKELYNAGTYVRPNLEGITMERRKNYYKISIPLQKTTENKAITSINERGSWNGGEKGIDMKELNDAKTRPMFFSKQIVSTGISDMTEIYFCWRNTKDFPIKTSPSVETKPIEKSKEITKPVNKPLEKSKETLKTQPVVNQKNGAYEKVGTLHFVSTLDGKGNLVAKVVESSDKDMKIQFFTSDGHPINTDLRMIYGPNKKSLIVLDENGNPTKNVYRILFN